MTENSNGEQSAIHNEAESASSGTPRHDRAGMALTGLILGIASIILALIPIIGLIAGILGIIFGVLGLRSTRRKTAGWGLGLGIAGIILSFFAFVIEIATILSAMTTGLHG